MRDMVQWRGDLPSLGSLEYDSRYFHKLVKNIYPYQELTKDK